jgi:hypothetical protein
MAKSAILSDAIAETNPWRGFWPGYFERIDMVKRCQALVGTLRLTPLRLVVSRTMTWPLSLAVSTHWPPLAPL